MQKHLFILLVSLSLTAPVCLAQSASADEEAIKTLCKSETMAFYGRKADAWESTWLHTKDISRDLISNNSYSSVIGWEKFGTELNDYLKANAAKPFPIELKNDNYLIRMGTDMAWIEYDQIITAPSINPDIKRFSREQRLVVKQNGTWKIAHMITVDPDTFKSDPANVEANLNTNGYNLLRAKKVTEAIEIFKTNVTLFPKSANAYDSLGEAYAEAGNKDLAIQNYEQSLQLNPKNELGKAALAKLKAK